VGVGVADDEAGSFDIDLAGLIAGNASSHRSFAWPGSSGRPGSLWESALPTMRPATSTSILLASSLATPAPTGLLPDPDLAADRDLIASDEALEI